MPADLFICCELAKEGFGSFKDFYYVLPVDTTMACYDYLKFRRDIESKKNDWIRDQYKSQN